MLSVRRPIAAREAALRRRLVLVDQPPQHNAEDKNRPYNVLDIITNPFPK